jgi:uncharacterized protein YllA (UPF0747 family)
MKLKSLVLFFFLVLTLTILFFKNRTIKNGTENPPRLKLKTKIDFDKITVPATSHRNSDANSHSIPEKSTPSSLGEGIAEKEVFNQRIYFESLLEDNFFASNYSNYTAFIKEKLDRALRVGKSNPNLLNEIVDELIAKENLDLSDGENIKKIILATMEESQSKNHLEESDAIERDR